MKIKKIFVYLTLLLLSSLRSSAWSTITEDMVRPARWFICAGFRVIEGIIGPIAVFIVIVAGAMWVKSDDDSRERLMAKSMIMNVIIGISIFLVAAAIIFIITSAIPSGTGAFNMTVFCGGV